jgi:hypothetical protein
MASVDSMRKVLAAKGITLSVAREAFANYSERITDKRAQLADAERTAAWWLGIVELLDRGREKGG